MEGISLDPLAQGIFLFIKYFIRQEEAWHLPFVAPIVLDSTQFHRVSGLIMAFSHVFIMRLDCFHALHPLFSSLSHAPCFSYPKSPPVYVPITLPQIQHMEENLTLVRVNISLQLTQ